MIYCFRNDIERPTCSIWFVRLIKGDICISKVNAINYRICIGNKWKSIQMRINTLKCEMEPAVAALQAELSIESVATHNLQRTCIHRDTYVYVCVCVCNCTHMPLCSTPQILAPQPSKRRSCSYGALHSTDFSIKIQIDANKWPSPIPQRVSETQLQLHYQAKSNKRGERQLLLSQVQVQAPH